MNYNSLTVNAYARGSTTVIGNIGFDYQKISGLQFETYWPGGVFGSASFYLPTDLAQSWASSGAYRVVFYNGLQVVYEGYVDSIDRVADESTSGILVRLVGAWGNILSAWGINKPWWDEATDAKAWVPILSTIEEQFRYQVIEGKIHISPDYSLTHATGTSKRARYTAPIGQTVKRLKFTYDFKESSGSWEQGVYRATDSSSTLMTDASGETYTTGTTTVIVAPATGTVDVTLGEASRYLDFEFYSAADNTPGSTDHIHGMIYDISVRTETDSAITAAVVIADVLALCTDLNTSTAYITAPTVDISPFVTDGYETFDSIISRALKFGGASAANYYAQLLESDYTMSGNGKPILQVAAWPALTSYDYEIALTDKNLVAPFTLSEDYSMICNYVIVQYTDNVTGLKSFATPDDDASLTDATSTGLYGRRIPSGGSINAGQSDKASAILFGARYLLRYKSPIWRLSTATISVNSYIRKSGEIRVPCSEIRAGERVLFSNFPASPTSDPLMGSSLLVSVITRAVYSDDGGGVCALSFGDLSLL